jgi:putative membrane protein
MEAKLMRIIMTPAAVASWLFGLTMIAMNPGLLSSGWMPVKLLFVIGLTAMHILMNGWRRDFAADANHRTQRFFRVANEIPTLGLMVIVVMVIVRPF